jgi:hypothetical protein
MPVVAQAARDARDSPPAAAHELNRKRRRSKAEPPYAIL